jgi:aspartate aminotransferase
VTTPSTNRLDQITESETLRFSARAGELKAQGRRILSLGLGEPQFPTPPHIVEATYKAMKDGLTRYSNPYGLPDLRAAIAEKLRAENGLDYAVDEILVAPGAKNALHMVFSGLLTPGDEVVNIVPCYVSYDALFTLAGPGVTVKNVWLREDDYGLDLEALARAFSPRTRLVVYNSPHNPSGRVFAHDEIRALASLAIQHDCLLVSDEIYEALVFGSTPHLSPAAVEGMRERTIVINGFSKTFAMTGWRIGYLAAPKPLVKKLAAFQSHTNTNTCTFVQKGALAALKGPLEHVAAFRSSLGKNADTLCHRLTGVPNVRCPRPDGGLFALLDTRAIGMGSDELCLRLVEETGVATTPGVAFGAEGFVRVSLANTVEETTTGIDLLADFLRGLSP